MRGLNDAQTGAVEAAHAFFDTASGWSPPTTATLAEWMADGACRAPDDCAADPEGWCEHGLASWWLVLRAARAQARGHWDPALLLPHPDRLDLADPASLAVVEAHEHAVAVGQPGYLDPATGLFVMTARSLWERRSCCGSGCRHCPYVG